MRSYPISVLHAGALALVLVVLAAPPAKAGKHPVPLEKDTDSAKCIECHGEKSKGKSVHSAIAMGCTTCHEIRPGKDITRIKLTTTTAQALCLSCHADKKAADIRGKVHPPAVRDCVKCHDPHASENKNQLLKPASGDAKENICLSCHKIGVDVPNNGSRHAALDMGCDTCHTIHKSGDPAKPEFAFHLTKATPPLCIGCHDPLDAGLKKAHMEQPFEGTDCLQCHDPHQSRSPKLMQAFLHTPFESKMCDSCHKPAQNGKVVLAAADAKSLCVTCHEDKVKGIEEAKVQHPGAAGDCTDCHSPHASAFPGLPKTDPVNICLGCHSDQAEQMKKAHLHQPAFAQGCSTCHQAHGGANDHLLRAKDNALCLECHGPDINPVRDESAHVVTIFDGKVRLPENYFGQVKRLPLKYGRGHPIQGHPTSDMVDPRDSKVTKLSCLTCHQPHASVQAGLLVKDQANNMAFCGTCHKASDFLRPGSGAQ